MSAREGLIAKIVEIVGDDAVVIGVEDNKDALGRITIVVKQRRMLREPAAPNGTLRVEYVISVTHPAIDPAISEPALDDFVPSLLADLDLLSWFGWTDATKVADDQNLGYDIDCWLLAGPAEKEAP